MQRSVLAVAILVFVLIVACVMAFYWETAHSIESVWRCSETFAHGYVIIPIALYLVWRERGSLVTIPIVPTLLPVPMIALAGLGWFVAQTASVLGGAQFMLVAMVPLAVWAVFGTGMLRALAFPLAFLFFAVPFGEFAVPKLMDWTADFTILALKASGVPVFREGNSFNIPSGRWSLIQACSGARYLIASLVVGTLYAYLTYRSLHRRLAFIAAAIAVPLVANWVRAYMIVMIGHMSSNRLAVGVDHAIYGSVFFGVVMALLFGVASVWREDFGARPARRPAMEGSALGVSLAWLAVCGIAVLAAVSPWPLLYARVEAATTTRDVRLGKIVPAAGWAPASPLSGHFRPDFQDQLAETTQYFANGDVHVGVFIGYYAAQTQRRELISYRNQLVRPTNIAWRVIHLGRAATVVGNTSVTVRAAEVIGDGAHLVVWQWYWVDGRLTANDVIAKILLAWSRLTGSGDDSAVVVLFSPVVGAKVNAEVALGEFAAGMGSSIARTLQEAGAR